MTRSVKCSPHIIIRLAENYQALTVATVLRGTIDAGLVPNNIVISVYLISDLIYEINRERNRQYVRRRLKKILKNRKKESTTFARGGTDEQDLKYDLKKKELIACLAYDQLSVIKIYFKESQITLCTNGKDTGDRSRAHSGRVFR